jgi:hypothetical protein
VRERKMECQKGASKKGMMQVASHLAPHRFALFFSANGLLQRRCMSLFRNRDMQKNIFMMGFIVVLFVTVKHWKSNV